MPNTKHLKIKRIATQVYIGAFQGEESAKQIEQIVTAEEFDQNQIVCTNMAVATKDIAGKTNIRELGNPKVMEKAISQAMLGGLLGSMSRLMIGDSAGARAAREAHDPAKMRTSALVKAATNKVQGMDKERLAKLGNALQPGTSFIVLMFDEVLVTDQDYAEKMKDHQEDSDFIVEQITEQVQENLAAGKDIAFHILFDNGNYASHRVITGKDAAMNIQDIVIGQDSMVSKEVNIDEKSLDTDTFLVTPEAVTQARTLLTSSLVAYEISTDTDAGFIYESGGVHESDDRVVAAYEKAAITKSFMGHTKTKYTMEQLMADD